MARSPFAQTTPSNIRHNEINTKEKKKILPKRQSFTWLWRHMPVNAEKIAALFVSSLRVNVCTLVLVSLSLSLSLYGSVTMSLSVSVCEWEFVEICALICIVYCRIRVQKPIFGAHRYFINSQSLPPPIVVDWFFFFFFFLVFCCCCSGRSVGRSFVVDSVFLLFIRVSCLLLIRISHGSLHLPYTYLALSHLFTHSILDWNGVFARRCFVRSRACGLLLHRQKTSWITENGFRFNDAETDSFSSPMYSECASLNTFHFVFIPFLSIRWKVEDHRKHICSFIII